MAGAAVVVAGAVVVGGSVVVARPRVVAGVVGVVVRRLGEVVAGLFVVATRVVAVVVVPIAPGDDRPPSSPENTATAMNKLVVAAAGPANQTQFLPMPELLSKARAGVRLRAADPTH